MSLLEVVSKQKYMRNLQRTALANFTLENGKLIECIPLTYQLFGKPLGSAPLVVVNHALTGNSTILGENGWWSDLLGENKTIDTARFTLIAFNIPGNGYDDIIENLIVDYKNYTIRDIARIFWEGLISIGIDEVFAIIGGSLGGAIAWEMAVLQPKKVLNLIPIASDWKATDWMIANVLIQDQILNNSINPLADARLHAMILYRTPESINQRFNRKKDEKSSQYEIESWLNHHGSKLQNRFHLSTYRLMNHLLKTNDITRGREFFLSVASTIEATITIVSVNSDYFFIANENWKDYQLLKTKKENVFYHEINSIHGHDAFLIEYEQLSEILKPIFNKQIIKLCLQ